VRVAVDYAVVVGSFDVAVEWAARRHIGEVPRCWAVVWPAHRYHHDLAQLSSRYIVVRSERPIAVTAEDASIGAGRDVAEERVGRWYGGGVSGPRAVSRQAYGEHDDLGRLAASGIVVRAEGAV